MSRLGQWVLLGAITTVAGLLPGSAALADDTRDACSMLQTKAVEAAFAPRKFEPGKPGMAIKGSKSWAGITSCSYTSRGATIKEMLSVTLNVRRAQNDATATTPAAAKAGVVKLKATPVDVAGLGDNAYWANLGSNAFPVIQLNVFRGKYEWMIFGSSSRTMDKNAMLAGLTRIAKATMDGTR
jgi:hypothetical protein